MKMAAINRLMSKHLLQATIFQTQLRVSLSSTSASKFETNSTVAEAHCSDSQQQFSIRKANVTSPSSSLVLLFGFYNASESALSRYCSLYHRRGYDVLCLPSHLKHFAWPKLSVSYATELLNFVSTSCGSYNNLLVHAFSMGAYNFTVFFGTMYANQAEYANIQNRIRCVVYDSLTIGSLTNMVNGVTQGISKNPVVRQLIPFTAWLYFAATHKHTVQFYDHYVDIFKSKPLEIPTLFYYCKNDPMSREDAIEETIAQWRSRFSFPIEAVRWDESKHAAHLVQHEQRYVSTLYRFLQSVPALNVSKL